LKAIAIAIFYIPPMVFKLCISIVAVFTAVLLSILSCEKKVEQHDEVPAYETFRDIPGVTAFEIKAVEALQAKNDSFVYGSLLGTETFNGQNGKIEGYTALFCEHLTKVFGIKFKPVLYEWSDLIAGLANGNIDFTGELTANEKRRKTYYMTDAISERSVKYFHLKDAMPFSQISESRLLRYGFLDGAVTLGMVSLLSEDKFEPYFVPDHNAAYAALKSGEIDAFLDESNIEAVFDVYDDIVSTEVLPLIYSTVSLTTQKAELAPIISIVQKMLRRGYNAYSAEMHKRGRHEYTKTKLERYFNEEEREYMRQNPVVRFAAEFDNYPISFYNKYESQWQGVVFDALREVEMLTGLSFEVVNAPGTEWFNLFKMLEDGKVSIMSELIRSKDREGSFLWSETALMKDKHALISKLEFPDIGINDILYSKVGLIKGSARTELFKFWFPNHPNTVEFENTMDAFEALEHEKIDLLMASQNRLLFMTNYMEQPGYKVNILFEHPYETLLGFNKSEHVLRSIVEKTLQNIDTERIAERWEHKIYDYRIKFAETQFIWLTGSSILFLCIIILLFVLYEKNRSDGKRLEILVQKRTEELEEQRRLFEHMSLTDQLTKLPNRRNFDMRLDLEWRNAIRGQQAISILMLDIDNFKDYNDKYGHQKGDEILCAISKSISKTLKRSTDFVSRWGGEEFAILLSFTNAEGAFKVAELIRANIENLNVLLSDGVIVKLTVSIGVNTQVPGHKSLLDTFISDADKELYRAKEMGKNKVCSFNDVKN
jgi:diguanylate cyclase (GGDEF)-like protein